MEAWQECEIYNKGDVITLVEVFNKLAKYDQSINFSIYEHKNKCICGSDHFVRDGYKVTNSSKKMRFRCGACGKVFTARIEELPTKLKQGLFQ
jgi:transposase-like protein